MGEATAKPPRSVVIVEDDAPTRAFLSEVVQGMPELRLVAAAETLEAGRTALEAHAPEVLLTDLGLPDGSGVELVKEARARSERTEIVVITMFGDEWNVIRCIEEGASGYLLKGGDREAIERALRELLAGGSPISPAIARHVLRRLRPAPAPAAETAAETAAVESPLSGRETDVLELVAKGFTFGEIAGLLEISIHTVTTHMRRVYRKLEVHSKTEAVYEASQRGLIDIQ